MLVAQPDLELLSAVLVLLWPLGIIFPVWLLDVMRSRFGIPMMAYFMISLSLMIFLISAIKMELTHTDGSVSRWHS